MNIVATEKVKQDDRIQAGKAAVNSVELKSLLKRLVRRDRKRVESIKNVCGTCAKQRIFEERPRGISPDGARDCRPIYAYQSEGERESMKDRRGNSLAARQARILQATRGRKKER